MARERKASLCAVGGRLSLLMSLLIEWQYEKRNASLQHQYLPSFNTKKKNKTCLACCYQMPSSLEKKGERRAAVDEEGEMKQEDRVTYARLAYLLEKLHQ